MASYTRQLLSGSTNGRTIPVAANATPGTLIHQAVAGTSAYDEVYAWVSNVTNQAVPLTIEWGGVTDPGDHAVKQVSIPPNSPMIPILTGQVIQNGLNVRAFAGTAAALNIVGYVNRIS
jgi:hypothetical protein